MNDTMHREFVRKFAAAWASRDGEAFLALWHPEGLLHSPLFDRPIAGAEIGRLNDLQKQTAPDLVWQLLDWMAGDDVVVIEWQSTRIIAGARLDWRGVDRFRLRDGRIVEERVYMDTGPLRAARAGIPLEPILQL
ncbi:MAG TPA: nuclear transport factor 2 family protein [Aliidongia sp.]|uniref:nuclear transport factor 2 family protein n=1 Tax=Aliidongia sp. TaxID=1914230 RepID=UPI002DDCA803|nr:nuclear transport factor 2 family protein [Aliidongia sp.]HEV2678110.1 nuclear transport factor 2 family protein [Aliidongia sp.]